MKRFVGLNAAGMSWLLGLAVAGLLVNAGWHLMVVVIGVSLVLGALQLVLGGQSATRHFRTGRRGMWKLFALTVTYGTALVVLGTVGWLVALVIAAPALAVVLVTAICFAALIFGFAIMRGGWL